MGFPKTKGDANGLDEKMGSTVAEDEKSNVNWQRGGQKIGNNAGRLKFGKSSVSDLNKGVGGCRDDYDK